MQILDPTETQPLTFLYKLDRGRCSKSHGFHAAKVIAGWSILLQTIGRI